MPKLDAIAMLKWIHFLMLAMAGGGAIVALLLSGFESEREDLQGLAATVWKKTVTWGFRFAVLIGLALVGLKLSRGEHPFDHYYLHGKMLLVVMLLAASEMAPRMLASGRRGAAMTALFLFLITTFVVYNKDLFPSKPSPRPTEPSSTAGTAFQPR
ncbi:MAG TPA: hypothetical protein VJ600_07080 [Holophagaceae bacterium]|nr:hypothetical protein [Holophagaceae bacterium]